MLLTTGEETAAIHSNEANNLRMSNLFLFMLVAISVIGGEPFVSFDQSGARLSEN